MGGLRGENYYQIKIKILKLDLSRKHTKQA